MQRKKFSNNPSGNARVEDESVDANDEDIVKVSRFKPPSTEKEDPYLEGIADSLVIAFFLAAAIKLFLFFFPMK